MGDFSLGVNVYEWLGEDLVDDPAVKVCRYYHNTTAIIYSPSDKDFLPNLLDHLLGHLLGHEYNGDEVPFTPAERRTLNIDNGRIFRHQALQVNYATYDLCCDQDSINPRTHPDIILLVEVILSNIR